MAEFVYAVLATFGVSALISNYDGPQGVLVLLRAHVAAARCCVCLSVWLGIPIALLTGVGVVGYLAIVGTVILLERLA